MKKLNNVNWEICEDYKRIIYKSEGEIHFIAIKDILYFESQNRKIRLITTKGEKEFYGKIKDIKAQLNKHFVDVHRSYYVQERYIRKIGKGRVVLVTGEELPISRQKNKCWNS